MKFTEFSVTVSKYFITKLHIHDIIFYTLHSNIIKLACDFLNIYISYTNETILSVLYIRINLLFKF